MTGSVRGQSTKRSAMVAEVIAAGYRRHADRVAANVGQARDRYAAREWSELHEDSIALMDMYGDSINEVLAELEAVLGDQSEDRALWGAAREVFARTVEDRVDAELAATFYNSITRRVFTTVGIDDQIEFASIAEREPPPAAIRSLSGAAVDVVQRVLGDSGIPGQWRNLGRDSRLAVEELTASIRSWGQSAPIDGATMLDMVFYRGQGAYLVGRLLVGEMAFPIAFCVNHTSRGLVLGAALTEEADINVLFSYTRAAFHVVVDNPASTVAYLSELMPRKRRAELYSTIGYRKHAKTELYAQLMAHVAGSDDRFEHARGIRGMVMIVFTLPGFDVVFKVIRDRFPFPKQTTRRQIMAKYRLVFHHDRAGRLIDAQEFEHLRFDRSRFTDEIIAELESDAARTVTIDDQSVTFDHVYVERRVIPLDIYVREANPVKARAAIVDYGRAIKNLAATNIFPGDMLLKNFGVTRTGRIVFYDYDEITELTRCKFREMPDTDNADDEMSATAWFGVGDDDIFPEEFTRFLGLRDELREVFDFHHSDLFGVRFWQRVQNRVRSGETIEIFPYERTRRLGAHRRSLTADKL
ncbi:MAG: bifunctional isocitrate dehydrogenase kinase/phosphatase [bacterium]|nr:bifunctional isocitrate dehydrogenase kinase/phosphatase [bacterium]